MCSRLEPCPVEPEENRKNCHAARKKLWQLDSPFHCSIMGTCLSLQELRELNRKLGLIAETKLSDYELHRAFVGIARDQSYASRRLNKYLDQKYRTVLRRFAKLQSDAELEKLWEEALDSGKLAGPYWALTTHPHASGALLNRIYGEVHMLSHLAGATVRVDMQEFAQLQKQTAILQRQLRDSQAELKTQNARRNKAQRELQAQLTRTQSAEQQLQQTRQRLATMENDSLSSRLQQQLEEYADMLGIERQRVESAEASAEQWKQMALQHGDRHLQLEQQLSRLHAERNALEANLEKLLAPDCSRCEGQDGCMSNINLCGRCILYVGGRTKQAANFRALVESQNGRFMHHDGGLHDGRVRLKSFLSQADAVLCPLDCVSHDAVHRVKQFCKRYGKRLVLLPRSSLAAFTQGLNELAA